MNIMFKMLFTILLGILLFISTITANSLADTGKQDKIIDLKDIYEKGGITKNEYDAAKRKFSSNINKKDPNIIKTRKEFGLVYSLIFSHILYEIR